MVLLFHGIHEIKEYVFANNTRYGYDVDRYLGRKVANEQWVGY